MNKEEVRNKLEEIVKYCEDKGFRVEGINAYPEILYETYISGILPVITEENWVIELTIKTDREGKT